MGKGGEEGNHREELGSEREITEGASDRDFQNTNRGAWRPVHQGIEVNYSRRHRDA